ncbi:hypothetical protein [Microcoleus sp. herbarium2]|uniref:hypothetical protein n=1 Tax=Microcoleus sp. herbarium2 TaxID=3055433 RepID=UPI002FD67AEE
MKAKPNMTPAQPKSTKMTCKNTPPQSPSPFQYVFATVIFFTLLSGGVSFWISTEDRPSSQQARIFETCNSTWNMGVGAIFGLLSSKVVQDDDDDDDDE